jgi:hypothetical protein
MSEQISITQTPDPQVEAQADAAAVQAVDDKNAQIQAIHDANQPAQPATPAEPGQALYANKYKTRQDLENGVSNIRSKLGLGDAFDAASMDTPKLEGYYEAMNSRLGLQGQQQGQTDTPAQTQMEIPKPAPPPEPGAMLDMQAIQQEYMQNSGQLSEATYADLQGRGFDRQYVNAFIQGQQALAEKSMAEAAKIVGGEAEYDAMIKWAEQNLNPAQQEAFNKAVNDPAQADMQIRGLHSLYKQTNPTAPSPVGGDVSAPDAAAIDPSTAYASFAQYKADIAKQEYREDPAFRKVVDAKMEASHKAGIF